MYGMTPIGDKLNTGVGAGMGAGGQLNTQPVTQMVGNQMMLDPQQQLDMQRRVADQTAMDEIRRQALAQGIGVGLGNQVQNATAQRTMAINAQANAAQNVANQLNNLANIRAQGANTILGAMQAGLGAR